MTVEWDELKIKGYNGRNIENRLLKQTRGKGPLSIVFPGLRYNVDMPLLYYSIGALIEAGYSVLTIDTRYYDLDGFITVSNKERTQWIYEDVEGIFEAAVGLDGYDLEVLVGKSLGTVSISHALSIYTDLQNCKAVWLTPLLKIDMVLDQIKNHQAASLVVIGTSDQQFDKEKMKAIEPKENIESLVIAGGNHSLDVSSGLLGSIKKLKEIISKIRDFIV